MAGCGIPAAPAPPSLRLPQPITDLSASRTANTVTLHWTMPRRTTDKVTLKGDQDARIYRKVKNSPCQTAGDIRTSPAAPAEFIDHLPAALTTGPPRLLTYFVELRNRAGRTAGPSNPAYTVMGAAPAAVTGLAAEVRASGIVLQWQPSGGPSLVRITRQLLTPKSSKTEAAAQTLEATAVDRTMDKDAAYDHSYLYTVQRVRKLNIAGHSLEIAGGPSQTITVEAKDVFPPAAPTGLLAVADPEGHAIDLSWTANAEQDLAGYAVYRRKAGTSSAPARISPAAPLPGPSFRDTTAQPGIQYDYSVSAIDHDGNESPRSAEVEESLPGH